MANIDEIMNNIDYFLKDDEDSDIYLDYDDYKEIYTALKELHDIKKKTSEPSQRFIVNGINNDKIELVSNLDVRKLNRLIDATKQFTKNEFFAHMVTNGDAIKITFPNAKVLEKNEFGFDYVYVTIDELGSSWKIRKEFWDDYYTHSN